MAIISTQHSQKTTGHPSEPGSSLGVFLGSCLSRVFPSHRASISALLAVWGFRLGFCIALCNICWCKKGLINTYEWYLDSLLSIYKSTIYRRSVTFQLSTNPILNPELNPYLSPNSNLTITSSWLSTARIQTIQIKCDEIVFRILLFSNFRGVPHKCPKTTGTIPLLPLM
jgi:hypothetical protein